MNVYEIVKKYLDENNYDGLYWEGECGCYKKDLHACGENFSECKPGNIIKCKCGEELGIGQKGVEVSLCTECVNV